MSSEWGEVRLGVMVINNVLKRKVLFRFDIFFVSLEALLLSLGNFWGFYGFNSDGFMS